VLLSSSGFTNGRLISEVTLSRHIALLGVDGLPDDPPSLNELQITRIELITYKVSLLSGRLSVPLSNGIKLCDTHG